MTTPSASTAYDETPYPTYTFEQTHPDRLATIATIFGVTPVPPQRCRVLELGCASGGNLLPMALGLPESSFVGVDLSGQQIAKGKERQERLGLRNVSLHHRDIMDLGPELGQFDYIIAHGVFSWVPRLVQDRMLALCEELLAPDGVAYISYATYPGCATRKILRDLMRFHTRGIHDRTERVAQARAAAAFFADAVPAVEARHKALLEEERRRLEKLNDELLLHDDLAEINDPIYFHEFVDRARQRRLKYLGDARFHLMYDQRYSPEVREALRQSGDVVVYEQYLDFLSGRAFRETLLCREEIQLNRAIAPEVVTRLCVEARSAPASDSPDLRSRAPEQFISPSGVRITLTAPIAKAALVHLWARASEVLSFAELHAGARALLGDAAAPEGEAAQAESRELCEALLGAYSADATLLRYRRIPLAIRPGERPAASPFVRLLAEEGGQGNEVITLHHRRVSLQDTIALELLPHLTGKKTREELTGIAADAITEGRAPLPEGTEAPSGREEALRLAAPMVAQVLEKLGRLGLLIA